MSSEAAQKAYPDMPGLEGLGDSIRAAFDRGAVEALRQAADRLRAWEFDAASNELRRMAGEWEAGR